MKRRFSAYRWASVALAAGLVFVLAGDRGITQSPQQFGIDPLEVLNLQIKPNVIIVLDTSTSMRENVSGTFVQSGDAPYSKTRQGKEVIRQVVKNNEKKVSFLFATYTQTSQSNLVSAAATDRLVYYTTSVLSPSMTTTQLIVSSVYAFQHIGATYNHLYFHEGPAVGGKDCDVTIPVGGYVLSTAGTKTLEAAMAAAMNSCSGRPGTPNTYTVSYSTGKFTFTRASGSNSFQMQWSIGTNSIREVLAAGTTNSSLGTGSFQNAGDARIEVLRRGTIASSSTNGVVEFGTSYYQLIARKFWNGQTITVLSNGTVCDITNGTPGTGAANDPPYINLQLRNTSCTGTDSGSPVKFPFSGGKFSGGAGGCNGFQARVALATCDSGASQIGPIEPFLDPELKFTENAAGATLPGYVETPGGTGAVQTPLPNPFPTLAGLRQVGGTPIAKSLNDLKVVFKALWDGTQPPTTSPLFPVAIPASGPIISHLPPREETIVLFVTDGDDSCDTPLVAAASAQALYAPIAKGTSDPDGVLPNGSLASDADAASSVKTYLVAFGNGASANNSNYIAWGGSGMVRNWSTVPTAGERALCTACTDAFMAPTAADLEKILDAIINLGATKGEFTAQQSLTASVLEYVDIGPAAIPPFSALNANNRYRSLTPVLFLSSFTLPSFDGKLTAFVNKGGVATKVWRLRTTTCPGQVPAGPPCFGDAGEILTESVSTGMIATCGVAGECRFDQLHGGATDSNIRTSLAAIKRRVYTTSQNGYYGVTVDNLLQRVAPFRAALWPPQVSGLSKPVAPAPGLPSPNLNEGLFDQAMGLPLDTHPDPANAFLDLQRDFKACLGSPLPSNCTSSTALTRMKQARKEAREMILAFMAGARIQVDSSANPKRVTSGTFAGEILYIAKSWALADSTLATPALVGQPLQSTPDGTPFVAEYTLFRDGTGADPSGDVIVKGFGLRNPDIGVTSPPDTLRPVMSVIYAGANDMLHAFRAGPSQEPTSSCNPATAECGGQELWGFVPFDRLGPYCQINAASQRCNLDTKGLSVRNYGTLGSRVINIPPQRNPHDYMIAAGLRAFDVFIPGPRTESIGGVSKSLTGVWRRVLLFGRGAGGKYFTALDITAPGPFFKKMALDTVGPFPLWSRGNPDTSLGVLGGSDNNTLTPVDKAAYAKMGQTWSVPAIGFADKTKHITARKPQGVDFVAWMGSGYGDRTGCPASSPCEGTTFYTLDVLTGDVIKSVDVEPVATANGMGRSGIAYGNALVASPAGFVPDRFVPKTESHPAVGKTTRVYLGDLYGRVWKFLTEDSSVAIPLADVGANQPIGTAASLIGLPPDKGVPKTPSIYLTSGNDSRASGPFKIFGFRDDGADAAFTTSGTTVDSVNNVTTFLPAASLFTRTFDQGPTVNTAAASPFPVFRGTVQPATAFSDDQPVAKAFTFFAGTRFNPPGSAFAPVPPPYPCRSTFDTIIFALKGDTGAAAYDLNASGDDAYTIFQSSRVVGIKTTEDPTSGTGSALIKDEGLLNPAVPTPPPPPPGLPPQTMSADVKPALKAGQPMPLVKFGSTACQ